MSAARTGRRRPSVHAPADAALQLSLPLFDATPPSNPQPAPATTRPSPHSPSLHAPSQHAQPPTAQRPGLRAVRLFEHVLQYELRRSRRRTIGFLVDGGGLRVTAPRWVSLAEIEGAVQEKGSWIVRKLVEWRAHEARRERLAVRWEHGAPMRYLGETLTLSVCEHAHGIDRVDRRLVIGLPAGAGAEQLRDRVQCWLKARAREVFAERIPLFAERLGSRPSRWSLSSARTRWGSCTPDGAVRLNWRLVHFPLEIIDYVIAHELAHLRELNHGPRFWSLVGELFPEFERARSWLREFPDDMPVS